MSVCLSLSLSTHTHTLGDMSRLNSLTPRPPLALSFRCMWFKEAFRKILSVLSHSLSTAHSLAHDPSHDTAHTQRYFICLETLSRRALTQTTIDSGPLDPMNVDMLQGKLNLTCAKYSVLVLSSILVQAKKPHKELHQAHVVMRDIKCPATVAVRL